MRRRRTREVDTVLLGSARREGSGAGVRGRVGPRRRRGPPGLVREGPFVTSGACAPGSSAGLSADRAGGAVQRERGRRVVRAGVRAVEADVHRAPGGQRAVPGRVGGRHGRAGLRPGRAPALLDLLAVGEGELQVPAAQRGRGAVGDLDRRREAVVPAVGRVRHGAGAGRVRGRRRRDRRRRGDRRGRRDRRRRGDRRAGRDRRRRGDRRARRDRRGGAGGGTARRDDRVGVLDERLELGLEPLAGERGVRRGAGQVVRQLGGDVGRVAHAVEALALVVRDLLRRTVGLARGLDPDVRVEVRGGRCAGRRGHGQLADAGTERVAPGAAVGAAVDARLVHVRVEVRARRDRRGTVRAAPAVAGRVDEHAGRGREALGDEQAVQLRRPRVLTEVGVPLVELRRADRVAADVQRRVRQERLGQRRAVGRVGHEAVDRREALLGGLGDLGEELGGRARVRVPAEPAASGRRRCTCRRCRASSARRARTSRPRGSTAPTPGRWPRTCS